MNITKISTTATATKKNNVVAHDIPLKFSQNRISALDKENTHTHSHIHNQCIEFRIHFYYNCMLDILFLSKHKEPNGCTIVCCVCQWKCYKKIKIFNYKIHCNQFICIDLTKISN